VPSEQILQSNLTSCVPTRNLSLIRIKQEEWQRSLMSWQHPEVVLEGETVAALSKDASGVAFMEARRLRWQASFRSLYYAMRNGTCKAFYMVTPKVPSCPLPMERDVSSYFVTLTLCGCTHESFS